MKGRGFRRAAAWAGVAVGLYAAVLRPRHMRWGASDEEATRSWPGDDLLAEPAYQTTHSVAVHATPDRIWPWLVQMGQGRGGLYSYDRLENLLGLDLHSADSIIPEFQATKVGDVICLAPDGEMPLVVTILEPERALVLRTGHPVTGPRPPGDFFKAEIAATWGFFLSDAGNDRCRLTVRFRADWTPSPLARVSQHVLLEPAHFIMERKMMLGIKERAERPA